jgi:hypothetical protein
MRWPFVTRREYERDILGLWKAVERAAKADEKQIEILARLVEKLTGVPIERASK